MHHEIPNIFAQHTQHAQHAQQLRKKRFFYDENDFCIHAFIDVVTQSTDTYAYVYAHTIEKQIVIYQRKDIEQTLHTQHTKIALMDELHHCLLYGPGVFVIRDAYPNKLLLDACNTIFSRIIANENGVQQSDHFALPGTNQRIWNSYQKLCQYDPQIFIEYFANPIMHLAYEAWLGTGYQITSQVNIVKPQGKAQQPHRDYHLGFQSTQHITHYPLSMQIASQLLTLQGAVAHTNMPIRSGATRLLPHSQKYPFGYMFAKNTQIIEYFDRHYVSVDIEKGDAIFFNPALFHAAGDNHTQHDRGANLLQINAAFGTPMETINMCAITTSVYPHALEYVRTQKRTPAQINALIACVAQGYAFPTNLDTDPPPKHGAPQTLQHYFRQSLLQNTPPQEFYAKVQHYYHTKKACFQ